MAASFTFEQSIAFSPENAEEILRSIPALPGVFALYGQQENAEPYLTRAADLRRRMKRLLAPPESQSRRLNLRDRVARIEYTVTGSEFESTLTLYHAAASIYGYAEARRRLRLHTPTVLRMTMENEFPRVYATNRLSRRGLAQMYGPFPSRAAAERYCDAVLDLFKLRRCHEDLAPYPEHPGCVYGEMHKCIEPCKQACTPEQYAAEAAAVKAFFDTRGESMLTRIGIDRDKASEEMEFERAAELHEQYQKVKAAASLADELVRPIPQLRAVIVQKAAEDEAHRHSADAAIILLQGGCLLGPERLSTLGVRAVKEQTSVGSSLFAQPLMLEAVPLEGEAADTTNSPEQRARAVLERLEAAASPSNDVAMLSDHLSLLRRWYYRPEKQRAGEVFLPNADGGWPIRRILNGTARVVLGDPKPMADTDREAAKKIAKETKTRILHEGRPDVERVVPVITRDKQ
ncbi:MAG: excinuclease ABC subunit C [Edaphobacter sp.]|uniref:excinuclease ABC subunit C n=1 Tax=Edaphobacter sp. TaxID=1934404 RepID=UPI00238595FC|nr:excinuclease ABC subunit C [Edaphobacter sp.]MDE1176594.1 excinuclease ABC subunit C [Edaphobacter sp.]